MNPNAKASTRISAQFPPTGLPGQNGAYVIVPVREPRQTDHPGGLPGEYEVVFTLNRPGYPLQPEGSASTGDALNGDSHLHISQPLQISATVEQEAFTFEGKPNAAGFLASLTVKCNAENLQNAQDKCYRALTPLLSIFSLKWDIPLAIYQVDVQEASTQTRKLTNRNPFDIVSLRGQLNPAADEEARVYAAIYREALITDSTTYQFLCFFRLIESIQARRIRVSREHKKRNATYTAPIEIYPRTESEATRFLNSIFLVKPWHSDLWALQNFILLSDAIGKNFDDIIKNHLKPIRVNIAHTLLQRAAELISMDDPLSQQKVEKWLPAIRCITRTMLKNDFGHLFT